MCINRQILYTALLLTLSASLSHAEDLFSTSGRLNLRGVDALNKDSTREDPSLTGRLKIDTAESAWRAHSWLEGGWDGSVRRPAKDHALLKTYTKVYQDNTPYLEIKELYVAHAADDLDLRAGIQRFAWGRLDEFPSNDLLNPWDYSQFIKKPLEDRKIGVPSLSASLNKGAWTYDTVWVPWLVPYRLPKPDERWSGISNASSLSQVPNADINPAEPDLPPRTLKNSNAGFRAKRSGDIEWALNLYHGFDPKPVFKTTALTIDLQPDKTAIDPGYVPDFHRITSIGLDSAAVKGDWSIRAEAAFVKGRYFNIRKDLWGYPIVPLLSVYQLNPNEVQSDALDYGIGADYRLFEDGTLTIQAQQTVILDRPETLYERKMETILWASIKAGWMNQKLETTVTFACNPEHRDNMAKANAWYVFTDSWKAGVTALNFTGPSQSVFGKYARNDQVEAEVTYSW